MSKRVTFIHASDLHLGAPFRGLRALSSKWANRLLSAIPESYDRMVDAAIARDVDFVVVSGDIFDSARPSYGDYLHFFEGLERLGEAGIPVYLITGNHDPYTSVAARLLLAAAQTPPCCRRPPRLRAGGARRPTAVPDRRPRLLQPDVADGRVHRRRRARAQRLSRRSPSSSARCGSPVRRGSAAHGIGPRSGEGPGRPRRPHAGGHGLLGAWAHPHEVRPTLFRRSASRVLGCIQGRDIKETGERGCFCRHAAGRRETRAGVHSHGKRRVAADARGRGRLARTLPTSPTRSCASCSARTARRIARRWWCASRSRARPRCTPCSTAPL